MPPPRNCSICKTFFVIACLRRAGLWWTMSYCIKCMKAGPWKTWVRTKPINGTGQLTTTGS